MVLKSQLNGRNEVRAIDMYAVPVIRYPAGLTAWPKEGIEATDTQDSNLQCMEGFTPSPAPEGGRGLVSVRATIQVETTKILESIKKKSSQY